MRYHSVGGYQPGMQFLSEGKAVCEKFSRHGKETRYRPRGNNDGMSDVRDMLLPWSRQMTWIADGEDGNGETERNGGRVPKRGNRVPNIEIRDRVAGPAISEERSATIRDIPGIYLVLLMRNSKRAACLFIHSNLLMANSSLADER